MHPIEKSNRYYLRTYKLCCLSTSSVRGEGQVLKEDCPASNKRTCPLRIKLEVMVGRYSRKRWTKYHHVTLCQKFKTELVTTPSVKPTRIEAVEFPPKNLSQPYFSGRFSGTNLIFMDLTNEKEAREATDFLITRKAWARNIAHQENLIPGQSTQATFDGQEFTISIGPRWGVNIR